MPHVSWLRVLRQCLVGAAIVSLLTLAYELHNGGAAGASGAGTIVVSIAAGAAASGAASGAASAALETAVAPGVHHIRSPRYWRLQPCGFHPRVQAGGYLTPQGISLSASGTCYVQAWCDDPLFASAGEQLTCRVDGQLVCGGAGFVIPVSRQTRGVQTGRCAAVTAVCSARGRFELPGAPGAPSVVAELWPPPDGSAAVAVFCSDTVFRLPLGRAWTPSLAPGAGDWAIDASCNLTRVLLADTAVGLAPLPDRDAAMNQTFLVAPLAATPAGDTGGVIVTVFAAPSAAVFCVRWFYWPLAIRGARLAAVGGFSVPGRPALRSTMCLRLPAAPSGGHITFLLLTDAVPAAFGVQAGLGGAGGAAGGAFNVSTAPDNTLPMAYRLAASHSRALRVSRQPAPFVVYDTAGTPRALVPPDSPRFPDILLDGWMPACGSDEGCTVVFVGGDSSEAAVASLCYLLESGVQIVSPLRVSTAVAALVHVVGQTLQVTAEPPVALVPPGQPLVVLPPAAPPAPPATPTAPPSGGAAAGAFSIVSCGMNQYRVPAEPLPPTHCMPTASLSSVGALSRVWVNESAAALPSTAFADCSLRLYATVFGSQIAYEPCVPTAPGSTLAFENVEVCAAATLPVFSAASAEVTRQLGLAPPLYAHVIENN
jgi:hypothetical protein